MSTELSRRLVGTTSTMLIGAALAAGCGGSSEPATSAGGTPTAPAPATVATTTAAAGRAYLGATSQGLPISFVVTATSVDAIRFAWRATCADHQMHENTIVFRSTPIAAGAFSASGTLNTGAQSSVSGHVSGSSASGRLSRSGPSAFGTTCSATGVSWTAHAAG
jgi:hypothetical protein